MDPATLARFVTCITSWRAALPPDGPTVYRPHQITSATGVPRYALPAVLAILGWHRAARWSRTNNRRVRRVYYALPGHRVPRPARGRPSIDQLAACVLNAAGRSGQDQS